MVLAWTCKDLRPYIEMHFWQRSNEGQVDSREGVGGNAHSTSSQSPAVKPASDRGTVGGKRKAGVNILAAERPVTRLRAGCTCGGVGVEEEQPTGGVEFLLPEPPARISSVTSLPPWLGSRIRICEDNGTKRTQTSLKRPSRIETRVLAASEPESPNSCFQKLNYNKHTLPLKRSNCQRKATVLNSSVHSKLLLLNKWTSEMCQQPVLLPLRLMLTRSLLKRKK